MVENGGNVSRAMKDAKYSVNTFNTPQKLTDSKGFQELAHTAISDVRLLRVHSEGLRATKIHSSHTEPDREVPDHPTRHKFLETGYKIKGYLKPDIDATQINISLDV